MVERRKRMNESGKRFFLAIIGIVALMYVVSPVDLVPGPVDDAVIVISLLSAMLRD